MTDSNDLANGFWPYRSETPTYRQIPEDAGDRADVYEVLRRIARREDAIGDAGRVSGSLYSGDHDHYGYLAEMFGLFGHANVLQRDMYPRQRSLRAKSSR